MVPGILKALQSNRSSRMAEGVKLFEVSDVMLLDPSSDVGARNERRLAALYTGPTAGFEVIHGLVDRIMQLLEVPVRPFKWQQPASGGAAAAPASGASAAVPAATCAAPPAAAAAAGSFGRGGKRYYIEPAPEVASYFPGRGARVVLESADGGHKVVLGTFGVLHPKVLANFELVYPVSVVELNIEPFLL
jgi:phenylalanyl-tRNA synthetase beta chain